MRHFCFASIALVCAPWAIVGCQSSRLGPQAQASSIDNEGYSLLYDLLSKQKDVDKLLWIKSEAQDVNTLLQRIAAACANAAARLETFAKAEPAMNLKLQCLPPIELATRKSIESARAKSILFSGGKEFEVRLLLSQGEGMSYGTHLAGALVKGELHPERKAFLEHLSRELGELEAVVLKLVQERFRDLK